MSVNFHSIKLGSFSNGDGSENIAIKMNLRFFKRRRHYSHVKFPGVEFLETAPKFRKWKKNCRCVFTSSIKRPIRKFHV